MNCIGIFYIKIQQILLIWFSEPDTEPKIAAEPGSAEPGSAEPGSSLNAKVAQVTKVPRRYP